MIFLVVIFLSLTFRLASADSLALRPVTTETRLAISLDGIWNFRLTNYSLPFDYGFQNKWFNKSVDLIDQYYEQIPVPASFNDIISDRLYRDFQGWSWYDRNFFTPPFDQKNQKIILRFGSVNYQAVVHVNGHHAINHTGGHLPFETDITDFVIPQGKNHISVAVNNELTNSTLPPGKYSLRHDWKNEKFTDLEPNFDFFPYAGIQRSVTVTVVPIDRIIDLTVLTNITDNGKKGIIRFQVEFQAKDYKQYWIGVEIFDRDGNRVNETRSPEYRSVQLKDVYVVTAEDSLTIPSVKLWWPFTMDPDPGYLYRMTVSLWRKDGQEIESSLVDRYHQQVGIRTIRISQEDSYEFLINNRPFYFRGFGRHEEYDIRGRALDPVMILKDFNLIKWIGANSFRTSHYPYSEEMMDQADQQGIVIIDECPAVGLKYFSKTLLNQHLRSLNELIERDKNRPSVVMWSVANEASSNLKESKDYFEHVCDEAKKLDLEHRPITAAINQYKGDHLSPLIDVLMLNFYSGWYHQTGHPQMAHTELVDLIDFFGHQYPGKPIMISEYGADCVAGLHTEPTFVFSEDYQTELMIEHHRTFDYLREKNRKTKSPFIGEHIWNFADFMTVQTLSRVGGNRKGMFTRQRQPKASARLLRCRYWTLANVTFHIKQQDIGFSYCPA